MNAKAHMKKITQLLIVIAILLGFSGVFPTPGQAQEEVPAVPPSQMEINEALASQALNEYTFADLGLNERTLNGPFETMLIRFGLPADWELAPGAQIQLDMAFYYDFPQSAEPLLQGEVFGGLLRVAFNGVTLTSVYLDARGDQTVTIPITEDALVTQRDDGRYELELALISDENCLYDFDTIVVIKPTSRLILPHQTVDISTDLALLPRPIFQTDSIVPDIATLVVPDQLSGQELRAILIAAAGFGRFTDEKLLYRVVSESGVTAEMRETTHLVYVGKSEGFPSLDAVELSVAKDSFTAENGNPTDGIVQMAVSPWNPAKAVLVISGDSDEGVVKAAQAFASGLLMGIESPSVARIADVNPYGQVSAVPTDRTLADLGYITESIVRYGAVSRNYTFFIPPGQEIQGEAYFELNYAHSSLLEYDRSGVVVELNGEPIASAAFRDETAQFGTLRANLPPALMRPGDNRLTVVFALIPRDICAEFFVDNLWFTIFDDSLVHLPLIPAEAQIGTRQLDLSLYPDLFSLGPAGGSVGFVLPKGDAVALDTASRIAFNLGDDTNWSIPEFGAYFVDELPENARQSHDLVLVGRASQLPIVAELSAVLPAPFDPGSDAASVQGLQVTYRLPETSNLGYVELAASPFNTERAVMAVLGNSDAGLAWAGAALTVPDLRGDLSGNLALVNEDQIVSVDTRRNRGINPQVLSGVAETPVEIPVPTTTVTVERPAWVLPAIGGVAALMVAIALVAIISALRRSRNNM